MMACMVIKFEEEIQGLWLLGTLLDTWETFRTSLSNSAPDGVITMELAKDASDTGVAPKQPQPMIPQTTAISNIKLPILKKEEYDIWAMEMEHYLEYIDNEVWKVIQKCNSRREFPIGKEGVVRVLYQFTAAEIQAKSGKPTELGLEKRNDRFQQLLSQMKLMSELKLLYDEQMNQLGDQEAQILAYSQAVKKLEAQLVTSQKQQLSLNEKLAFQANEIHEKDEKLKRYRRIGMKAVKDKEQLQKTVDSWKDSSKNLWRLINSGMSSNDKLGLGNSIGKPSYSRFTKTNDFKGVPPPLSGDYTPQPQEEIDDSLYVYGKKGPQKPKISVSDENSSEHSSCQSNDSEGSCENISEHSFETESESVSEPNEMSKSRLEVPNEKDVSATKSKEVEPSCVSHIKTPRQPLKDKETHKVNRKNWNDMMERELGEGYSFTKKKCFVCGSLNHLIKDCDYYEKKMAREAEVKRVVNTVQLNAGRPKLNSVRPNINTGRTNINSGRPKVNAVSPKVNTVRPKQPEHPLKNMVDRGIFDSGCSGHMTGNKDQLEDFEEFNGGSVTFGGSKGYISGKGRIRVGNLDFDSVSFVKELGHFNLFSISQICDKQHKVLFTETECLVVSSDFKMPDENQILLKVPRHHNMYSFDMKTPSPAKGFACLIAKATSDESKLWHRRLGHINFKNLNKLVKGNLVRKVYLQGFSK
ncbi:ribonuclease H-like domain-containing protein [Tanacetum coccineum]